MRDILTLQPPKDRPMVAVDPLKIAMRILNEESHITVSRVAKSTLGLCFTVFSPSNLTH